MNTLRTKLMLLLALKSFQVYLPVAFLVILNLFLIFFTLQTGAAQVFKQLGIGF